MNDNLARLMACIETHGINEITIDQDYAVRFEDDIQELFPSRVRLLEGIVEVAGCVIRAGTRRP